MAYCRAYQPGGDIVIGDKFISGAVDPGQFVVVSSATEFILNGTKTALSFGLVLDNESTSRTSSSTSYVDGNKVRVAVGNGLYETDNFTAGMAVNELIAIETTTGKIKAWATGDAAVGKVLYVDSSKLIFQLFLAANAAVE